MRTSLPKKKMNHSELTSSGFWVGHILMIIATIAGVYLAAQAGLQQAILFDDVIARQNNYFLRQSLYEELQDNVAILKEYDQSYLSRGISANQIKANSPKISRYVWETMKYSQTTLETPSYFLGETRRFYAQVNDIIAKRESFTYGPQHASKLMQAQLENMENNVLPKLKANTQYLATYLEAFDVYVDDIKGVDGKATL
ncbi:hypothetical protein [Bacterioplanoides sp. SCSIO 12839]|uniref:hypothetical protein n=1 Tax=Bacterioplanoides sp. SCSIO 12839 TaxID=2829569 RepID=UPI0021083F99|nr:hypothetical protein [Bacterioplanoides sp. SCSIO 12839]UTW49239.1 hypothetical protein KFF03_04870 [Bacterioplanoides sp. SCSIO 12839]